MSPGSSLREIVIQSLSSLGIGLVALGMMIGSTSLSTDIRLLVLLGAIALLICGFFVGAKIGRRWLLERFSACHSAPLLLLSFYSNCHLCGRLC
jgi:energy-coupling factor transporter transmembrane protein EcfT